MDCKTNCVKMMHLGKNNMSKQQKMRVQLYLITILFQNQTVHHPMNLHVLGLNYYSTFTEMIKAYRSMDEFDTTEMMTMINTARYGLQDQLLENDRLREEEHFQAAEDESSIPSDHNPGSESSGT